MSKESLFIGMIFIGLGSLFVYNDKNIAKGAEKFYAKIYTEKNLRVMFKAAGALLIIAGVYFLFFKAI